MNWAHRCTAAVLAALLALPCAAAAPKRSAAKPAPEPVDDLSVAATRHAVVCPLPKLGPCVIRKPVDTGYRILTPGIDLEDRGDRWLGDFTKQYAAKAAKLTVRILGSSGDLHEIEIAFLNGTAAPASRPKK